MRVARLTRLTYALVAGLCLNLGAFTPSAHATDLTATCTPSPNGVDGKPLPTGETLTFNLYGALCGVPLQLLTPTPLAVCKSVRSNVTPGTICYAWTEVGTLGTSSLESAQTPPFSIVVAPPATQTQPPTGVTAAPVTVATTVYTVTTVQNAFGFLAVGTVPLGTPCLIGQSVNNFNVVPTSAVTWTGTIHPLAVLAACSVTK